MAGALLTFIFPLSALLSAVSANKSLSVSISAPSTTFDVSDFHVITTITNTGDETLKLLNNPESVLSRWATDSFQVFNTANDSISPSFTGVHVRYGYEYAAKSDDESKFTILAPSESVEVSHEVGKFYNFTTAGAGSYTFKPSNVFYAVEADKSLTIVEASIEQSAISELTGQLFSTSLLSATSIGGVSINTDFGLKKRSSDQGICTASMRSMNDIAIKDAATLAKNSINHLKAHPAGSPLQTTWYGTFDSGRYDNTLKAFKILETAPADWTYDCSCTNPDVYAFVYKQYYGEVHLCGLYWDVPATGSGSRADTIIHEGTHFTQVMGTEDHVYREAGCKELAKKHPSQAVDNADNHAFFSDYA